MKMGGGKRRNSKKIVPVTLEYLVQICKKAKHTRDGCLVALLYLSGRRISEVLPLKKMNMVQVSGTLRFITFNMKAYRNKRVGDYKIKRGEKYHERIICAFSLESESGKMLGPYILEHLETLFEEAYIFHHHRNYKRHITRQRAWQIVTKLDPDVWLHWFRHQRFTQVSKVYMEDPIAMHKFTHHKRFESTLHYIHEAKAKKKLKEI